MIHRTLVDTGAVDAHLNDPSWVVVDCRFTLTEPEAGRRAWRDGHIPGARYAHLDDDLSGVIGPDSGRHPLPDPQTLAVTLGALGIGNDTQVIVYDDSFGAMASRLWWLLRWLGHDAVALLDGGLPKWRREQRPLTAEAPSITPRRFHPSLRNAQWVDVREVALRRMDPGYVLLDARSEERFLGEIEPLDPVAGHVPGARNRPYDDNLDFSGELLPAEELRAQYAEVLVGRLPDQVIHMCGSGVTACHSILAMEHAGLSGSRLYAGSWSEWIRDPARPVATGEG